MKAWTTWLGIASTLSLVGLAAAACDGPTIIIQNVIGDAGGTTDGQDAGADAYAGEVPDASLDAGEVVTSCTAGTVTAKPTPLYLELVVASLRNRSMANAVKRAIDALPFDDGSLGIGLKATADPDVDDAGLRAAQSDGGTAGAEAYRCTLRDLPQVLTSARQFELESLIDRAVTAAETSFYGTRAQFAQFRAWNPSGALRGGGRRAMLIVQDSRASGLRGPGSASDVIDLMAEATGSPSVLAGVIDARDRYDYSGRWTEAFPTLTDLGLHGDPECESAELPDSRRPPTTRLPWGTGEHPLCVPTLHAYVDDQWGTISLSAAIAAVIGELRACEYEVHGFDARFGGALTMHVKGPDGFSQRIYRLQDADAGRLSATNPMRRQPAGFVLDDVEHPSKVTVTGEACLILRRDQARTIEITTTCP